VKEVRSFVGMASFYRRFIPHFSDKAAPIIALTRKYAKFKWDNSCQNAFDYIKNQFVKLPMLGFPDQSRPYIKSLASRC
jgi:hypothetical protein